MLHMALDTASATIRRVTSPGRRRPGHRPRIDAPPSESRTPSPGRDIAAHHAVGDKVAGHPVTRCWPGPTKLGPPSGDGLVPSSGRMVSHMSRIADGGWETVPDPRDCDPAPFLPWLKPRGLLERFP